jgi:arsenite methyltransferase
MTSTPTTAATTTVPVDPEALRASVRSKYRELALDPSARFHFHTGRPLADLLGYDPALVAPLPDRAVAAFAGVANPFSMCPLGQEDQVVDVGSGGGFDTVVAAQLVGPAGHVIGVDMTTEMLERARETARQLGLDHLEFRRGIAEELPVDDGWADVVISNGVLNLVADKPRVFAEIHRVLRPGGRLQFADIAVGREVPEAAVCDIDLWTDCIAGGRSTEQWEQLLADAGFEDVRVGPPVDTFGGAPGERNARAYEVAGHPFFARKPG